MWRFFFIFVPMSGNKPNKESSVKLILADLKASVDKKVIWDNLGGIGKIPRNTFYRWYAEADALYNEFLLEAAPIIKAKEIQALGEIAVSNILSKTEAQYILSQIAKGKVNIKKDAISRNGIEKLSNKPSAAERVNAIDKLAKMNGWNIAEEDPIDDVKEIKVIRISNGA